MKYSIKDFFSKFDQIPSLRIWSHLLKKSFMENFIFCAVYVKLKTWKHRQTLIFKKQLSFLSKHVTLFLWKTSNKESEKYLLFEISRA